MANQFYTYTPKAMKPKPPIVFTIQSYNPDLTDVSSVLVRKTPFLKELVEGSKWVKLKGSLIGGKGELISCFHVSNLLLPCQFYHVAGGEGTKRRHKSPGFEAKNRAFQN